MGGASADPYLPLTSCRCFTEGVSYVTHHGLPLGHPQAADVHPANEHVRRLRPDDFVIRADAGEAHRRRRQPATVAAAHGPRVAKGSQTATARATSVERETTAG